MNDSVWFEVGARRSSLRWNLVPDERIISPRRSRSSRLAAKPPPRSPSKRSSAAEDAAAARSCPLPRATGVDAAAATTSSAGPVDERLVVPRRSRCTGVAVSSPPSARRSPTKLGGGAGAESAAAPGVCDRTPTGPGAGVADVGPVATTAAVQPPGTSTPPHDHPPLSSAPRPEVRGLPDRTATSAVVEGAAISAVPVPMLDGASHRPVSDTSATERRPSYGHVPPHASAHEDLADTVA